jgi:hypothetical protein
MLNLTTLTKLSSSKTVSKISLKPRIRVFGKTTHNFHLGNPSPWPFITSLAAFSVAFCGVAFMRNYAYGFFNLFYYDFSQIYSKKKLKLNELYSNFIDICPVFICLHKSLYSEFLIYCD